MGTTTLKNALGDKNITVDNVDDTLADVKEILETNADIQFALSGAQFNDIISDGADEETLEAELMDLLEEEEEEDEPKPENTETITSTSPTNGIAIGHKRNPSTPTTITNVIDELLEERLNKLRMDSSNTSIESNSSVLPSPQQGIQ